METYIPASERKRNRAKKEFINSILLLIKPLTIAGLMNTFKFYCFVIKLIVDLISI